MTSANSQPIQFDSLENTSSCASRSPGASASGRTGRKLTEEQKAKKRESNRKNRQAHPEKERERNRKYREANLEKERERNRKYREANPEKQRERNRKYYEANPEKVRERDLKKRSGNDPRTFASYLVAQAALRAKARGLEFNLAVDYVLEQMGRGCAVTGIEWDYSDKGGSSRRPWVPSIDRINNSLGYVRGNVQLVCSAVNTAKNDLNPEAFLKLCRGLALFASSTNGETA